jgi:hypothetical protein
MGDTKNAYRILINPVGKRPLRLSSHRWEDIMMDLKEMGLSVCTG